MRSRLAVGAGASSSSQRRCPMGPGRRDGERLAVLHRRRSCITPPACPREGDREGLHCLHTGSEALHRSFWGAASLGPSPPRLRPQWPPHTCAGKPPRLAGGGDTLVRWRTALCSASITRRIVTAAATLVAGAVARPCVEQSNGGCRPD